MYKHNAVYSTPTPAEILAARQTARLTKTDAANLICKGLRTWQNWELGINKMPPAIFRLFRILTEQERVPPFERTNAE